LTEQSGQRKPEAVRAIHGFDQTGMPKSRKKAQREARANGSVTVTLDVKNTGSREGVEIVQHLTDIALDDY
jgi:hypothetical protein